MKPKSNDSTAKIHYDNGTALQMQGSYDGAISEYKNALRYTPNIAAIHYNLGVAFFMKHDFDSAIKAYRKALRLAPDIVDIHYNLGCALLSSNKLKAAKSAYQNALKQNPRHAEAYTNIGFICEAQDKPEAAITSLQRALEINPGLEQAHLKLADIYLRRDQHRHAMIHYRDVLALNPRHIAAHIQMGAILLDKESDIDRALEHFQHAYQLQPDNTDAAVGIARVNIRNGNIEEAYEYLEPMLSGALESVPVPAAVTFASICHHVGKCPAAVQLLEALAEQKHHPREFRRDLFFSLGRLYDSMDDYDKAFTFFNQGNRLKLTQFNPERAINSNSELITAWSAEFLSGAPRVSRREGLKRPVFIVGMPRSGTSLVEQILASHPLVYGAGELNELHYIVNGMPALLHSNTPYPNCLDKIDQKTLEGLAAGYKNRIEATPGRDVQVVTDKMPSNFLYLGLIELLFPDAKVIHCRRDPMDTCLSCYFQDFGGTHPYAYDLEDLGVYYRLYEKLMTHWHGVLQLPILDLQYEDLIEQPEQHSRRLIEFCDLDWDDRCLEFHRTERGVATSSYDQVRQPIYRKSVSRWKNYESHISDLKHALYGSDI